MESCQTEIVWERLDDVQELSDGIRELLDSLNDQLIAFWFHIVFSSRFLEIVTAWETQTLHGEEKTTSKVTQHEICLELFTLLANGSAKRTGIRSSSLASG
jgi:hypothetical protein